jgi:hypothetical protein
MTWTWTGRIIAVDVDSIGDVLGWDGVVLVQIGRRMLRYRYSSSQHAGGSMDLKAFRCYPQL